MNLKQKYCFFIVFALISIDFFGQNVSLYQQFNGRYDFTFIGNTMNPMENSDMTTPTVLTISDAVLNLSANDVVEKAYLYWAGSGDGDFNVKLNGIDVVSSRNFYKTLGLPVDNYQIFSSFADITSQIQNFGNGIYALSDLDVTPFIDQHFVRKTNFAGWAILIIFKNNNLPINQINVYDGLQNIPTTANSSLNISLNSLNVVDNIDAKIGFIAWEGDKQLQKDETLRINGNILSNPPLNPANNAFNGTNSILNDATFYNMDLDVYDIQNNINIGDSTVQIDLTSGQDLVFINAIVTKLNSQVPDATIKIDNVLQICNSNQIIVDYSVFNSNATAILPANVPVSVIVNYTLDSVDYQVVLPIIYTPNPIVINGNWSSQISFILPDDAITSFSIKFIVDFVFSSNKGIITELNETNNIDLQLVNKLLKPKFKKLNDLESCNNGLSSGFFDFSEYKNTVTTDLNDIVSFFENNSDAENNQNAIQNISNYFAKTTPKEIFVRVVNATNCYAITSFNLHTRNCLPIIYNVFAANSGYNDYFFIEGLRNIFLDFELFIYNRWGQLVWKGNNNLEDFKGFSNVGLRLNNNLLAESTYYYILNLNDKDYPKPMNGYLYMTK